MTNAPTTKIHNTVVRGRVDDLSGSQRFPLISWVRFELGYRTVLVHGLLLQPPRLKPGDEVVIAGTAKQDSLDARAIVKVAETEEERAERRRGMRRRRWIAFALVALWSLGLLALFMMSGDSAIEWLHAWLLYSYIIFVIPLSRLQAYREAELELALAMALGCEQRADEPIALVGETRFAE